MILDKKQIRVIFLFKFKAAETICDINSALGLGTANRPAAQRCFKFCKEQRLKDTACGCWPSEVDNDLLRGLWKLILLQLHEKLPKNSTPTIVW